MTIKGIAFVVAISAGLTACGGSGGETVNLTSNEDQLPVYSAGEFDLSSTFKAMCETPRTGRDASGQAYADQAGDVAHELFWLRSWSDETYLWYDEIPDQNPYNFSEPTVYFQTLKTSAVTPSGNLLDRFHFTQATEEWQSFIQSGESLGYGAEFVWTQNTVPREVRVAYVEADSPAATAGWARGDYLIELDGVSLVTGGATQAEVDTLNAAYYPTEANPSHTITVRKHQTGQLSSATVTAETVSADAVLDSKVLVSGSDKVGYLVFNDHNAVAEAQLYEAMRQFEQEQVDDLVVDLRYNGGGYVVIAAQLAAMVAGDVAEDKVFEHNVYNDKLGDRNPVTGEVSLPMPFVDFGVGLSLAENTPLPTLNLNRVFVLTGANTCSASEAFINGLRGIDIDVIQIGNTTCGKPYGFFPQDNCGTTYFTVQTRGENAKRFGDFADGFSPANGAINVGVVVPGCYVQDDLDHALGDTSEARLKAALHYRVNGDCNMPVGVGLQKSYSEQDELMKRSPLKSMKIYRN